MQKVDFMGWKDCIELKSGDFKLIVTTEIGPRVIGGFVGDSENLFCVVPDTAGKSGGDEWNLYGGHRLWHSPEMMPRSYALDNSPIEVSETGEGVTFSGGIEDTTGIYKSISIKALPKGKFQITHKLRNENMWDVELAAWALTVMAPGGTAVVPQPQGDYDALLPNRYLTVWPYTNMADPRLTWGDEYILLKQQPGNERKCKFGINCEDGWLAYVNNNVALVKSFNHLIDAAYPDNGCSIECFTNEFMLEIETLSPLYQLAPNKEIVHVETWSTIANTGEVNTEEDAAKLFG